MLAIGFAGGLSLLPIQNIGIRVTRNPMVLALKSGKHTHTNTETHRCLLSHNAGPRLCGASGKLQSDQFTVEDRLCVFVTFPFLSIPMGLEGNLACRNWNVALPGIASTAHIQNKHCCHEVHILQTDAGKKQLKK